MLVLDNNNCWLWRALQFPPECRDGMQIRGRMGSLPTGGVPMSDIGRRRRFADFPGPGALR